MKKLLRKLKRNDDGAVAVEFAFFAPVIMTAVGLMAMYGIATYDKMRLTAGARSVMQYVMVGGESEDVMDAIMYRASGIEANTSISTYCSCSTSRSAAVSCDAEMPCETGSLNEYSKITTSATRNFLIKEWEIEAQIDFRSS